MADGVDASIAVGGAGGGGGHGGTATVTQAGSIATAGSGAYGIMAQSIGGGGGSADGGTAGMSSSTAQNDAKFRFSLGIGGSGGSGGPGGNVTVTSGGSIATTGGSSSGIVAQSIGGGGGNGGSSDPNAGRGGSNPLSYFGTVYGEGSGYYADISKGWQTGVQPSSWGTLENFVSYGLSINIGGSGGAGGNGGAATVYSGTNSAGTSSAMTISTQGDLANGIFAQSIGAGGGNGGAATSIASKGMHDSIAADFSLKLGGGGGTAGSGGSVNVTTGASNDITTSGMQAIGILAQSVGGGGGTGGAGGLASSGMFSLGGALGGSGGTSGNGGAVTVTNNGYIYTSGDDSNGILAQSVGAGGGFGASAPLTRNSTAVALEITVGGGSGAAGAGGAVAVTTNGSVATAGARAIGIQAQSVGGGGGVAGTGTGSIVAGTFTIGGGNTGNGNNGGAVSVTVGQSGVSTTGAGAWGILAQSVGAGGGFAGDTTTYPYSLPLTSLPSGTSVSTPGLGNGGAVTVLVAPNSYVSTSAANAHAIVAQSVGGGGGIVNGALGSAGGIGFGGPVTVTVNGNVNVSGAGSVGILAQSAGQGGTQGNVTYLGPNATILVTIGSGGQVTAAGNAGAAVLVSGGAYPLNLPKGDQQAPSNTVEIQPGGLVANLWGGRAIIADASNNTLLQVNNYGAIFGTLSGNITMLNDPAVWVTSGTSTVNRIDNGAGGVIDIGGTGIATATINQVPGATSPYVLNMGATSSLLMDADFFHHTHDVLNLGGALALNGGTLTIRPGLLVPETVSGLVNATSVIAAPGQSLSASVNDLIFHYAVTPAAQAGGAVRFDVTPQATFAPAGAALNKNGISSAGALQALWDAYQPGAAANSQLAQIFTSFAGQTASGYGAALSNVYGGVSGAVAGSLIGTSQALASATQSCPAFAGEGVLLYERDCAWARMVGRMTSYNTTSSYGGYHGSNATYQIGGQKQVADGWFLGGSLAYDTNWQKSGNGSDKANGTAPMGAIVVKREIGPWLISGVLAGGANATSETRVIDLPLETAVAKGSRASDFVMGRVRASYEFTRNSYYVRPLIDLDVTRVHQNSYSESGAGAFNLSVDSASHTYVAVSPAVEIGGRFTPRPGLTLHPSVTLGVSVLSDNNWTGTARLMGQPFSVSSPLPNAVARAGLNLDLLHSSGLTLRMQIGIDVGRDYVSQSGLLRAAYMF